MILVNIYWICVHWLQTTIYCEYDIFVLCLVKVRVLIKHWFSFKWRCLFKVMLDLTLLSFSWKVLIFYCNCACFYKNAYDKSNHRERYRKQVYRRMISRKRLSGCFSSTLVSYFQTTSYISYRQFQYKTCESEIWSLKHTRTMLLESNIQWCAWIIGNIFNTRR